MADNQLGYDDTPQIPTLNYKVHDVSRPPPPVVTPPTPGNDDAPGVPPSDATVLFDGSSLASWVRREGGEPQWQVDGDYMQVVPGSGSIRTRAHFGDGQWHVEWAAPTEISGESQGRGNSGVFLMGKYEIQVLDCFDNPTYSDGAVAAIYGQYPPLVNASREPGRWQTYDLVWIAPRFEGGRLKSPARLTLLHNGVVVHHDRELLGPTSHRTVLEYEEHAQEGPLELQDHRDLVRYRNIWFRALGTNE
jgi:hypothetical protein